MKHRASVTILLIALICSTASAESGWVQRFLDRYRQARTVNLPAPQPSSLAAMAENGVISLTIEDVNRLLLENNRDVRAARIAPVSSYYIVETLASPFEPRLEIVPTISRTNTPSRSVLAAGAGEPSLIRLTHDILIGFHQALPTGSSYSIRFDFNRLSTNSVFETVNPSYNPLLTVAFTQRFLRDFGRLPNTRQILIAQNNQKISEVEFEVQIINLITTAQQAYWDLVFAQEDVKVKQHSLDLASKTLHENQIELEVGTLAPLDLVQAEAEVANRREDVITSQYEVVQLQDRIKKLLTNDTDPGLLLARLHPAESLQQPGFRNLLPIEQAIQSALENRPEMRQAAYDIQNQEINIRYARNQKLPVLDFIAEYTQAGLGGTQTIRSDFGLGEIIQVIPGGPGSAFNRLLGFDFPGYTFGLNLLIPIRNRAAQAAFDLAINERDRATRRRSAIAQQIALEVRNAYTQIEKYRARVETARTALKLATVRLQAEQKKYALGTSIVRFVLEEQRNLAQAQTNEVQALVDYTKAWVGVDRATGNTLRRNNVEIRKQLPKELTAAR